MPEQGWARLATHCENCAEGEASVLIVAAIRVTGTMRHISSVRYDACRVVSCRIVSLSLIGAQGDHYANFGIEIPQIGEAIPGQTNY